ncbi:exocyst complex component EXO70B1-like [Lactuca sativa]|uniref:exocyst complex component EXO70B1-like n=1 Tax=Lactuca sativa TaxID=4236 RepID=UPI001C6934D4|nr:exocyst complex component EXO70B1-like [Lactuca sativa]
MPTQLPRVTPNVMLSLELKSDQIPYHLPSSPALMLSSPAPSLSSSAPAMALIYREDEDGGSGSGYHHERGPRLGGDVFVDLIHPKAIKELKVIVDRMIRSGYEKECCQVYSNVLPDVLNECLSIQGVERLSIEEVQKIEWKILDEKMKKWIQAIKIVVKVLLFGEKRLCEQVFSESELIKEISFVETTKGCVMQLLNFGEAVAIGQRSSEKLFRILDMYDTVADVFPDFEFLFTYESGELVCNEVKVVLTGI